MKPMKRAALALIAVVSASAAMTPHTAFAQEGEHESEDGWSFELGAGAFYVPQYEGSSDYMVRPLPWLSARYTRGDRYVEFGGPSLKANVISGGAFEFGPVLRYEMGRDADDIDNVPVRRLGDIDGALMAGVFASTGIDLGDGSGVDFSVEAVTDAGDDGQGSTAKFEIGYRRPMSERMMGIIGVIKPFPAEDYALLV